MSWSEVPSGAAIERMERSRHAHAHTHTSIIDGKLFIVLVAHCQTWSRGSHREGGDRLKRNLGKMTQLAIEIPKTLGGLKNDPTYGLTTPQ